MMEKKHKRRERNKIKKKEKKRNEDKYQTREYRKTADGRFLVSVINSKYRITQR